MALRWVTPADQNHQTAFAIANTHLGTRPSTRCSSSAILGLLTSLILRGKDIGGNIQWSSGLTVYPLQPQRISLLLHTPYEDFTCIVINRKGGGKRLTIMRKCDGSNTAREIVQGQSFLAVRGVPNHDPISTGD